MPEAVCYFCVALGERFIHIAGRPYWIYYPCKEKGMMELSRYNILYSGFHQNNCWNVVIEISEALATILAKETNPKYVEVTNEVEQIYESMSRRFNPK